LKKIETLEQIEQQIKENDMVLFYFGMNTCGVCVDLLPKIDKMLEKYPEIKSFEIDARNDLKLAAQFDVFTAPVIVVYIDGKEGIREARLISVPDLESKIKRYYDMIF